METVEWKVEGMTCSNCALTIRNYLVKEGLKEINVNPIDGSVSFVKTGSITDNEIISGIGKLGYRLAAEKNTKSKRKILKSNRERFLFCLPFTAFLMLHMLDGRWHIHWLMNPWVQLMICLPVFITGMWFFGRSGYMSLKNGIANMNLLIAIGALASFAYSLTGALLNLGHEYLFFETTATIITLVFFGNYLEETSVNSTQKAILALAHSQKVMANMIAFDHNHTEHIFPIENSQLKAGDLILIKNGDQVPSDCKILYGNCSVDESIITGESIPVQKSKKDLLIGGSILYDGIVRAQVTAAGKDTVISGIIRLVKKAQAEKPPVQKMADQISAIFVPLVLIISFLTFCINHFVFHINTAESLMRSVAVLVISCPCAMGLATPAAIAVGLGRAARSGVLFRSAENLEDFKDIKQIVFDKTGTLTTGAFVISSYRSFIDEQKFRLIMYSLEKYSNHPVGKSIAEQWKEGEIIKWKCIREEKGLGIIAEDNEGNVYTAGSFKILDSSEQEKHDVYLLKNNKIIGWIDVKDEIRSEAAQIIIWLQNNNIKTIMLSGDRKEKCIAVAEVLGIKEIYYEKTYLQKLELIESLNAHNRVAMVGDGINDAPALAKASLGIAISNASQIALQSANVILMGHGLKNLPKALGLGRHTYLTIKQNLFWAFAYNVIAIPVAAAGFLSPMVAALAMAFSDVILAFNSIRLFVKKVL